MLGFPSVSNLTFAQENSYYAELSGGQDLSNLIDVTKEGAAYVRGRFEQTT